MVTSLSLKSANTWESRGMLQRMLKAEFLSQHGAVCAQQYLHEPTVGFEAPNSLWSTARTVKTGAKFASQGIASFIFSI